MGQGNAAQTDDRDNFRLRIGFPGQARDDVCLRQDVIRIGSDAHCDIVLQSGGVAPNHASVEYRHRCWMLLVAEGAERIHVNARPVRELALLRWGDVLSVGNSKLILLPESVETAPPTGMVPGESESSSAQQAGLRCVAGPLSGRFLLLCPELLLDHLLLHGVDGCLRVRSAGAGVSFELLGDGTVQSACNGRASSRGVLNSGDQLSWGRHRFVLETSVVPERVTSRRQVDSTSSAGLPAAQTKSESREMGWLLGVAALLAVCIAALLLLRQ